MILGQQHHLKIFSQFGEDGIIQTILSTIGEGDRTFLEIGSADGRENNTMALRASGWRGLMIDGGYSTKHVKQAFITVENLQETLQQLGAPKPPTVFSLDIDGNDFWVLKAMGEYLPTHLIVCEYNGKFAHDVSLVMPYNPQHRWDITWFYGGSQRAMHLLGNHLGYSLVYSNGVNMFMVARRFSHLFENADNVEKLYASPWSHNECDRLSEMVDPFQQGPGDSQQEATSSVCG